MRPPFSICCPTRHIVWPWRPLVLMGTFQQLPRTTQRLKVCDVIISFTSLIFRVHFPDNSINYAYPVSIELLIWNRAFDSAGYRIWDLRETERMLYLKFTGACFQYPFTICHHSTNFLVFKSKYLNSISQFEIPSHSIQFTIPSHQSQYPVHNSQS